MGIVDQTSYNVKTLFSDIELDSTRILDFTLRLSNCEELVIGRRIVMETIFIWYKLSERFV